MRPPDCDTTSCLKSAGESSRPFRRIVRSSSAPSRRPTGEARFCDCRACTSCPTLTPVASQIARADLDHQLALDGADQVHRGHARDAAQPPRDVGIGHAGELRAGEPRRGQRQRHDRPVRRIELREDRLLHLGRQIVADRRNLVADLLRGDLRVLREVELHDDVREAVERARAHPVDAADARDRLLDRIDDLALDDVGRRARVGHRDDHDRRVDLRVLVGVELRERHDAEDDDHQHRDDGENRLGDGGIGDIHGQRPLN